MALPNNAQFAYPSAHTHTLHTREILRENTFHSIIQLAPLIIADDKTELHNESQVHLPRTYYIHTLLFSNFHAATTAVVFHHFGGNALSAPHSSTA